MIEVISQFKFEHGKANNGNLSGLQSQVTICRYKGTPFFVRESLGGVDSFLISSGERWGDKTGKKPARRRQVLELLAPAAIWDEIAAAVTLADPLHRAVIRNEAFTMNWIKKKLPIPLNKV